MANGISIPVPQVTTLGQAISGGLQQAQNIAKTKQDLQSARAQLPLIQAQTALTQAQAGAIPATAALQQANAKKILQDIDMINTVGNAQTPPLMRAYNMFLSYQKQYGDNDPRTIAAKNNYDQMAQSVQSSINFKNAIASVQPIRVQPQDIREVGYRGALQRGGILQTPAGVRMPAVQPSQIQPTQSTKYAPTNVRNAVNGINTQNPPQIAPTNVVNQPNRLIHSAPQSGDINAQQQALLGQYSPAGIAQQKQAGTDVQTYLNGLGDASDKASDTLNTLRQFDAAYQQAIKGANVGPVGGLIKLAGMPLTSAAQIALKNGNQVVLNNLGVLKGTGSRISQKLISIMEKGNPNIQLSPDAEKEIVNQLSAQFQGNIYKSRLANTILNSYPSIRGEPQLLQEIVTKAAQDAAPVDEQGTIHSEMFDEWANYATPQAIEAIRSGKDWLPEDIRNTGKTLKQFRDVANAENIPILTLIKRFRAAMQKAETEKPQPTSTVPQLRGIQWGTGAYPAGGSPYGIR